MVVSFRILQNVRQISSKFGILSGDYGQYYSAISFKFCSSDADSFPHTFEIFSGEYGQYYSDIFTSSFAPAILFKHLNERWRSYSKDGKTSERAMEYFNDGIFLNFQQPFLQIKLHYTASSSSVFIPETKVL